MAFRLQWLKPCQELMSWGPVGCLPLADLPCVGNKNKLRKVEVENLTNNIKPPFLGWVLHVCWLKVKVETWGISYMLDHPGKRRSSLNQTRLSADPCQQPVDASNSFVWQGQGSRRRCFLRADLLIYFFSGDFQLEVAATLEKGVMGMDFGGCGMQ